MLSLPIPTAVSPQVGMGGLAAITGQLLGRPNYRRRTLGKLDLIAMNQLSAAAAFDLAVHRHQAVRDHSLSIRARVDEVSEFEELAEPDRVGVDGNLVHSPSLDPRKSGLPIVTVDRAVAATVNR